MNLLIVDDSDTIRRAIQRTVERPGDRVETAANGVDAIAIAANFEPDVVTMDISMPRMDGLTCIEEILRLRPRARILVVSSLMDKATAVEAVRRGATGYLLKPFTPQQLSFEISELA